MSLAKWQVPMNVCVAFLCIRMFLFRLGANTDRMRPTSSADSPMHVRLTVRGRVCMFVWL